MNYCVKCGSMLQNGACPRCGGSSGTLRNNMNNTNGMYGISNSSKSYRSTIPANISPNQLNYAMHCPRCGNKNLQMVTQQDTHSNGKNYSGGKGCLGLVLLGPLGLLCGMCGNGKQIYTTNSISWVCTNCGMIVDTQQMGSGTEKNKSSAATIVAAIFLLVFCWVMFGILVYFISEADISDPLGLVNAIPVPGVKNGLAII